MNLSRENNFDLIRLFAAFQVVILHTREHIGLEGLTLNYLTNVVEFFPGVPIFFTVSGFLIYAAFDRNRNFKIYFRNRVFRIYPALWGCLLFTITVLIFFKFINSNTSVSNQFYFWLATQVSFFQFFTPDFFRGFGVGNPNGSLWTIPIEISFYLFIPLFIWLKKKSGMNQNIFILLLMILSVLYNFWYHTNYLTLTSQSTVVKLMGLNLIPYLFYFLLGSFTYINWEVIRKWYEGKGLLWITIYIAYCIIFSGWLKKFSPGYWPNMYGLISIIILSQTILSLAYTGIKISERLLKRNDISYGVYLYHMPIVNCFIQSGNKGHNYSFVLVLSLTTFMAFLSWRFIEKPILSLKEKKSQLLKT